MPHEKVAAQEKFKEVRDESFTNVLHDKTLISSAFCAPARTIPLGIERLMQKFDEKLLTNTKYNKKIFSQDKYFLCNKKKI